MSYLLSVIIPTKSRYQYLKDCLKSIVSLGLSEIEIVVQDNTENNTEIVEYINKLNWKHIKYFHEIKSLSQSGNSELAVKNATGKYICYIGDDDTITEQMITIVEWLDKNNIESCIFPVAVYYWPDIEFKFFKYPSLSFPKGTFNYKYLDTLNILTKRLKQGATSLENMPKVYHGIVLKSKLNEIYQKTGYYFPGPSPDMANATALALIINSHVKINIPLMVSGFSFKSAGGMGTRGAHKAKIKDVAQLPSNTEELWEDNLPKIWLASTIWPESSAKALKAMGENIRLNQINWCYIYALIMVQNPGYYEDVRPFINSISKVVKTMFWVSVLFSRRCYKFAQNTLKTKLKITTQLSYESVNSLQDAMNIVNEYNKSKGLSNRYK
jgi:glycosyltransferase involved in cell wall biosynthesis